MLAEAPLCQLTTMGGNNKNLCWQAVDNSDGEEIMDKLAIRFKKDEEVEAFTTSFNDGIEFNKKAKAGASNDELTWADPIEDEEDKDIDDIDTNKMADED